MRTIIEKALLLVSGLYISSLWAWGIVYDIYDPTKINKNLDETIVSSVLCILFTAVLVAFVCERK